MKQMIREQLSDPEALEKLYREQPGAFRQNFPQAAAGTDSELVRFWNLRLADSLSPAQESPQRKSLWAVLLCSLLTGVLAKLTDIFPAINMDVFMERYLLLIAFSGLILFTLWKNGITCYKRILSCAAVIVVLAVYVGLLPVRQSDSLELVFLHIPLLLWCLYGWVWTGFNHGDTTRKVGFIRFNGQLAIMTGLILIAGGLLSAITIGLFSVIHWNIERFYANNVILTGCVIAPIVASYLLDQYPGITSRISPVLARLFTPLVLVTQLIYLGFVLFSDNNIMEDRQLLFLFNLMLLGVMALIVFSASELGHSHKKDKQVFLLLMLALLAIVIDGIAITAISSRVMDGITPNRLVVLCTNILILINLVLMARDLFRACFRDGMPGTVELTVAKYLWVYAAWTVFAIFLLPFLFGMR